MCDNTNELKSYTCSLDCKSIVSAGAGTGKTYNIQILVLRKILAGTPIEKILVVTFTNLATEELQERLRKVLQTALECCGKFNGDRPLSEEDFNHLNPEEQKAYAQVTPCLKGMKPDEASQHLKDALRNFDFASISTIHGFCSRTLTENAFESGLRYGMEMRKQCDALVNTILCKVYRKLTAGSANEVSTRCQLFQQLKISPTSLAKELKTALTSPRVKVNWGVDDMQKNISELSPDELDAKMKEIENDIAQEKFSKEELDSAKKLYMRILLKRTYNVLTEEVAKAKCAEGFMTFDDLLVKLLERLESSDDDARKLRKLIRDKYDCVMIDEFQDTDAVQSAIFEKVFGDCDGETDNKTLFFIGDEKQAIYKFRGGDVQTFQRTKNAIAQEHCYTLSTNYRSSEELIGEMNKVFTKDFFRVTSDTASDGSQEEAKTSSVAIQMTPIIPSEDGKHSYLCDKDGNRIDAKEKLLSLHLMTQGDFMVETASAIKTLYNAGLRIHQCKKGQETERAIRYQDFAILLRTATNVDAYREELKKLGIPSVFLQTKTIFQATEAYWMLAVMDAFIHPGSQEKALRLLSDPILGFSAKELDTLKKECLPEFQMYLKKCNELWNKKSFYFIFNDFLNKSLTRMMQKTPSFEGISYPPLPQCPDNLGTKKDSTIARRIVECSSEGENSLALMMQLAEKLMVVALEQHLGPDALYNFLDYKVRKNEKKDLWQKDDDNKGIGEDEDDNEAFPIHMTTQEDAVRLLTIHKSKGLEFPIVFVPNFTKKEKKGGKELKEYVYHDERNNRCINMDEDDKEKTSSCNREKLEESKRLMYVAITRACYLCRFISMPIDNKQENTNNQPEYFIPEANRIPPAMWFTAVAGAPAEHATRQVQAQTFGLKSENLYPGWVTTSFSAIATGKKSNEKNKPADTSEENDVKGILSDIQETLPEDVTTISSRMDDDADDNEKEPGDFGQKHELDELPFWQTAPYAERTPLFQFPGGTRTGTCWHEVMEKLDFTQWKEGDADKEQLAKAKDAVLRQLDNYAQLGRNTTTRVPRMEAFYAMLTNLCNTPIFLGTSTFCLGDIPAENTLREFDFTYKIREGIEAEDLRKLLTDNGIEVPEDWSHKIGKQNLTGSIDLLLQNPEDEKFYILDWKTNILGANAESFTAENVEKEVNRRFYSFQCILYTLAFVQYYRQRKHGTDFGDAEREAYAMEAYNQFGGCADILMRGMETEKNDQCIHRIMPALPLILELDKKIGVASARL